MKKRTVITAAIGTIISISLLTPVAFAGYTGNYNYGNTNYPNYYSNYNNSYNSYSRYPTNMPYGYNPYGYTAYAQPMVMNYGQSKKYGYPVMNYGQSKKLDQDENGNNHFNQVNNFTWYQNQNPQNHNRTMSSVLSCVQQNAPFLTTYLSAILSTGLSTGTVDQNALDRLNTVLTKLQNSGWGSTLRDKTMNCINNSSNNNGYGNNWNNNWNNGWNNNGHYGTSTWWH